MPRRRVAIGAELTGAGQRNLLRTAAVAALAAILLAFGYQSTRGQPPSRSLPNAKLSVALRVLPQYALVPIAAAKGYFDEEGLDVSIRPLPYGTTGIDDLLAGNADLAISAEVPFVISVMKGNPLTTVASIASISGDNAIIARRDHGIATPRDLEGKTIGVPFATSGSYFLGAFLTRNRLSPDSIKVVNVPQEQLVSAISSGRVDAVSIPAALSPEVLAALASNGVSFAEAGAYRTTVVALGKSEFIRTHADAVEKFVRAMLKAEQFMRAEPDETLVLAAGWLKVDADKLRPTWNQLDFRLNLLQSQLTSMEEEARWAMVRGYTVTGPVPNFLPHMYLDALVAAQPERVTVFR
jgi:ABC-type nitrate/sulfonate/bicarbonate transport system substrate-binding protein